MAFANYSINDFITEIRKRGVARPTRFEVMITRPRCLNQPVVNTQTGKSVTVEGGRFISLLCENAILPQLNIGVMGQRIYGPNYQNPISIDYGGDSLPMSFIVDTDMKIKTFFDAWMHCIVNPNNYHVAYRKNTGLEYTTNIVIHQLDETDMIRYAVKLEDAFPRNLGIMDLNSSSLNIPHKLNVTFAYRKWQDVTSAIRYQDYIENANEFGI